MNERVNPFKDTVINENMLDNWYFAGGGSQQGGGKLPINQRGITEFTVQGYSIDRWFLNPVSTRTASLTEEGIATAGTTACAMYQFFEIAPFKAGEKFTLSVLTADGVLHTGSAVWPVSGRADFALSYNIAVRSGYCTDSHHLNIPYIEFWQIGSLAKMNVYVAAKLERGERQSLAHNDEGTWVLNTIPDFGQELAKCQRYQLVLPGPFGRNTWSQVGMGIGYGSKKRAIILIPLPVPLRARPNISIGSGEWKLVQDTGWNTGADVSSVALNQLSDNAISLYADTGESVLTAKEPYHLVCTKTGPNVLLIDANL